MREQNVIAIIEHQLDAAARVWFNLHGSLFSTDGTPDFLTIDHSGVFMGIEAKTPGEMPRVNQWRRCIEILLSKGRFIVAYDDFDLRRIDMHDCRYAHIGSEIGSSEFDMTLIDACHTCEIVLDV